MCRWHPLDTMHKHSPGSAPAPIEIMVQLLWVQWVQNWTLYLHIVVQIKLLMLLNDINSCHGYIPDNNMECIFLFLSIKAIDSIHQVGVYCLALVPANTLPKAPLGGIHISETKQRFLEGTLHPCNVLMCPHTCVTNLPKPRQKQPGQ